MTESNSINANTAGIVGNTGTAFTGSTTTQYNVLVGGSTSSTLSNVAPSATSGVPLVSGGSSANPSFTTAVVAGGGTGVTSATAYGIVCGGTTSTGNFQVITPDSSTTKVLTCGGSSALPTWQAPATAGSLVLIASKTASNSASITFTSGISATYNTYFLLCSNVINATSTAQLLLQISTNGGTSYLNSSYASGTNTSTFNSSSLTNTNSSSGFILMPSLVNTPPSSYGNYYFGNMTDGNGYPHITGQFTFNNSGWQMGYAGGSYNASATVNALQIIASSGNISTGTFSLYGVLE